MLNGNHHKTIRSTHGKYFKSLVPWKDQEMFNQALFFDERIGGPPNRVYNQKMKILANDFNKYEGDPNVYKDIAG